MKPIYEEDDRSRNAIHPLLRNVPCGVRVTIFIGIVVIYVAMLLFCVWLSRLLPEHVQKLMFEWGSYLTPRIACLFDYEVTHRIYEFAYQQPYPSGQRLQDALQAHESSWVWGIMMAASLVQMVWEAFKEADPTTAKKIRVFLSSTWINNRMMSSKSAALIATEDEHEKTSSRGKRTN